MFITEMAAPQYSGPRQDHIRIQQTRRGMVPPHGVNLYLYYGVDDQLIVVTAEAGALFIHGRTAMLYFYQEEVEGFVTVCADAY